MDLQRRISAAYRALVAEMQTVEGGEGANGRAKQLLQQKKARDHAKVPKPAARWQSRQEMERIAKEKQARGARRFRSGVGPRANITSQRETQGGGRDGGRRGDRGSGSGDRGGSGGIGDSSGGGEAMGEDDAYVAMREEQMKQQQRGRGGGGVRVGGGGEAGGSYGYSISHGDDDGNDDDYGDFFDDDDGSDDDDGGWIKSPLQTSRLDVLVDHRRSTGGGDDGDGDGDGDGNRSGSTASSLSLPPCRTSTSTTQYHKYASVADPRQTSSGLAPRTPSGHHTRTQRTELGDIVVRLKVVRDTCAVAHTARASKLEAALSGVFMFYCRDVRLDGQPRRDLDHMKVRGVGTRVTQDFHAKRVW